MSLGTHLLIEFYGCASQKLDDLIELPKLLKEAIRISGATFLSSQVHKFDPQGVTVVCLVAESHLAIHTWPEHSYAAIDFFSCGKDVEPRRALTYLHEQLQPDFVQVGSLERGKLSDFFKLKATHGDDHAKMVWHDWS